MKNYKVSAKQFDHTNEVVTAVIETPLVGGESYWGALLVGAYHDNESPELWIEREGQRVGFTVEALPAVFKALKLAAKQAKGEKT